MSLTKLLDMDNSNRLKGDMMYITCNKIGCNKLVEQPNKYCADHKKDNNNYRRKKAYDKKYDKEKRNKKYDKFYHSSNWKKVREKVLSKDNYLCQECLKRDKIKTADIVHHIVPLEVDFNKRLDEKNLKSLCLKCHNNIHNYDNYFPKYLKKALISVEIVNGCYGSGKTFYVNKVKGENDLVIDIDEIISNLSGKPWYIDSDKYLSSAIQVRNDILYKLSDPNFVKQYEKCWLIISSPNKKKIFEMKNLLEAEVMFIESSKKECIRNLKKDKRRKHRINEFIKLIYRWFRLRNNEYKRTRKNKLTRGVL